MRTFYSGLFYALTPFLMARLVWRGRKAPAYRQRWAERFGFYTQPARVDALWVHAVSVGEAEAAFPLIRALQRRFAGRAVLVTTTTPTGSARVKAVLGDTIDHVYLPYDMPDAVARFLDHFRPTLAVVMETEIWPNLYHACADRQIPIALVNARLSAKSARSYAKLPSLIRPTLSTIRLIAAQTEADAARFEDLGATPGRIAVAGNLKFDMELPVDLGDRATKLRAALFGSRPVWIAASTHEGEDQQILEVFARLRGEYPDLLLVLVPRHPERFDAVRALCESAAYRVVRRSDDSAAETADIFLLDTMGELRLFYGAADVAFVGGSLVPVGGHNVLEPAALGRPVLFGPHMRHFEEASRGLCQVGGAFQVLDVDALTLELRRLLGDAEARSKIGANACRFVEGGRGVLERVMTLLAGL